MKILGQMSLHKQHSILARGILGQKIHLNLPRFGSGFYNLTYFLEGERYFQKMHKTAKVILNEIGGVLKLKVDKQPIKLEIFMGYRFLSNGLKLDEGLKSKVTFLVDTLFQAGAPKGLFSIGLEPQNQQEIRFRFSIAQSQNGHHDGAS